MKQLGFLARDSDRTKKKDEVGNDWKFRPITPMVGAFSWFTKRLKWGGGIFVSILWVLVLLMQLRATSQASAASQMVVQKCPFVIKNIQVIPGTTYSLLMEQAGVGGGESAAIFAAAKEKYNLSNLRVGETIDLKYDRQDDRLFELIYQIDSEEVLHVVHSTDGWMAERRKIEYEIRLRTIEGSISSSLYAAAAAQGLDDRAVVALSDVFQWELDFAMDVQRGDIYRFIYEERYLDGRYVMPGRVLAAKFINAGKSHYAFLFKNAAGKESHFNENGDSVQKMFLKAPVAFKYISSGFTTGRRYVEAFNVSTGHRAVDYAAPSGTPIRAVGDGIVAVAGWNGPYGRFVSVRHNATYTTHYGHMSRIAVRVGQKVEQGQTIGYVGSTGFSTGPHLHYEMVKNGVKINPLREDFPGVDPVPPDQMAEFSKVVIQWKPELDE